MTFEEWYEENWADYTGTTRPKTIMKIAFDAGRNHQKAAGEESNSTQLLYRQFTANEILNNGAGFCVECGIVAPDEDGCCHVCGALAQGRALSELAANLAA